MDRCNFLGRNRHTEWFPGCGLTAMECWMEEAAEILKLLGTTQSDRGDGHVHAGRLGGGREHRPVRRDVLDGQLPAPDKGQADSTVARSQMGHVCFAVADKEDYEFGLSDLQSERDCRPALFDNPVSKAMAFFDTETVGRGDEGHPDAVLQLGAGQRAGSPPTPASTRRGTARWTT